jgi:2-oxoisovalerate dehydrogenase E1 component
MKSIVEMQFADFVSSGFNPIVNYLAKSHYRWSQNADVVIRMPCGAGVGAGPFHSQSNEAWFFTTPGLKIAYPSSPADAKGLLLAAIEDPNPVLFFEHKWLYRSVYDDVPSGYYLTEFGKARNISQGEDISIITYGAGVHWALNEQRAGQSKDVSLDILDLRTLVPMDHEAIRASVQRTGKVIVLTEDSHTGSVAESIASWIAANCFELLDSPIKVVASLDTPIPFEKGLEDQYLGISRLTDEIAKLMAY